MSCLFIAFVNSYTPVSLCLSKCVIQLTLPSLVVSAACSTSALRLASSPLGSPLPSAAVPASGNDEPAAEAKGGLELPPLVICAESLNTCHAACTLLLPPPLPGSRPVLDQPGSGPAAAVPGVRPSEEPLNIIGELGLAQLPSVAEPSFCCPGADPESCGWDG